MLSEKRRASVYIFEGKIREGHTTYIPVCDIVVFRTSTKALSSERRPADGEESTMLLLLLLPDEDVHHPVERSFARRLQTVNSQRTREAKRSLQ